MYLTSGNTDDRRPVLELARPVFGKLYADKGYISKELRRQTLKSKEVDLIYKVRKDMKAEALSDFDALMLKKRMLIETVIGQLKSRTQLDHTRRTSEFPKLSSQYCLRVDCLYISREETDTESMRA